METHLGQMRAKHSAKMMKMQSDQTTPMCSDQMTERCSDQMTLMHLDQTVEMCLEEMMVQCLDHRLKSGLKISISYAYCKLGFLKNISICKLGQKNPYAYYCVWTVCHVK